METAALARRTRAVEELQRLSTVAEPDDGSAELECDHFSLRGYVALLQKKDPKLCSLQISCNQQQCDEHLKNSFPVSVTKHHRWNCTKCLDRVKISGPTITSETVLIQQDGTNDGCSISIVRTSPNNFDSRRLFSWTQQSSQGNDQSTLSKTAQECNSKCSSPSGDRAVTAVNVPATLAEENVPDIFVERSVPAKEDLQSSPNNIDVSANILNDVSMDVSDLPDDVPQMISSIEGNGTQNPHSPKPCVVPNEDDNRTAQDVPNDDCNEPNVHKPTSGHKRSKQISAHKSNQVRNQVPHRACLKRNVGSVGKKKRNKSTDLANVSDLKFCYRKPKKMRRLSELIGTDQVGGSGDAVEVGHANTVDLCEDDKSKMPFEVGNNNNTPFSNQKVGETQSRAVKNIVNHTGVDKVDGGSSLMNWMKNTHNKKIRAQKKDPGYKYVDSSAVSNSNPDTVASSVGDLGQEKVISTSNAKHGNENTQNNNLEQNMQNVADLCQNESGNMKRGLSNGKSMILLKRKVLSTAISRDEDTENNTIKRSMFGSHDLPQMESEGTIQRYPAKVSLGKHKIQNGSGLCKQNTPKNKKGKPKMHEKHYVIDDIPMEIVELLARNQHERRLMTDTNSLENSHTQPEIAAVDCVEISAKDRPINTSTELDTNFQKSLASESKQKPLQGHASSRTEDPNVNQQDLHTQKLSQCHAASSTEVPNGHLPESQLQNSFQVQQYFRRDNEVTIACTSPIFAHHQHIAEVSEQSWSNKRGKKVTWDSFKATSRNSPGSTYGFQFRNPLQEVDPAPIHVYEASSNCAAHPLVIAAVDHCTKEAVSQVQPRSVPSTALTMEAGRSVGSTSLTMEAGRSVASTSLTMEAGTDTLYDRRIAGQSGLYPDKPMAATHLLRLVDPSTARGFTNYQRANMRQMKLQTQTLGSQYTQPDQFNASLSTSYGSHLIEKVPLTLQDLSRRQVQQNLHGPLRPHPRVGVLGSLLQQDIANWSENCGTQSGYSLGVSKGTTLHVDMDRRGSYETLNSRMFSAGWNALQLGSSTSVPNPKHRLPRHGTSQPWTSGKGKTVRPLDKLVRKNICVTNRNPADFTVISDKNKYMRKL